MKELYLIRHGRTRANELHQYCGASDLPLSEEGRAAIARRHYRVPADCRYLTSGMLRTEQTLQLLFGEVPHQQDPRFREISFGAFELQTYDQLKHRQDYQHWIETDGEAAPPGGESLQSFRCRILEGLQDLMESEGPVVLVTHGGVIALILEELFPAEEKNRYQWQPEPGCGYCITRKGYRILEHTERSHTL